MSESAVDLSAWSPCRGQPDAANRAFVVERLGKFPYPAIARMGGLSLQFVRSTAQDIGYSPSPRVSDVSGLVYCPRAPSLPPPPKVHEWRPSVPPRARATIRAVCDRHGLSMRDVMVTSLGSNLRVYAWCRQECYAELRDAGYSTPQIGTWFKRDHSTIMSGSETYWLREGAGE